MINSFADSETQKVFNGEFSRKLPQDIQRTARRKLLWLHNAVELRDLWSTPGNRLEKLTGERAEQYSIRINNQWRICFFWKNNNAENVEVVDYH